MLNIKVLGPGCDKCDLVEQMAAVGLEELLEEDPSLEITLEHLEDPLEIEQYDIFFTPALVVNEKVVCAGRVPIKEEVVEWMRAALQQQDDLEEA